jgi:hypothetical protein
MSTTSVRKPQSPALVLAVVAMVVLLGVIALVTPSAAQSEPTATTVPTDATVPPTTVPPTTVPADAPVPPVTTVPNSPVPPVTAAPEEASASGPRGVPLVVGDSLSYGARNLLPAHWWVRAWPGLALYQALPLLTDSHPGSARCVVVAFGSNDVGRNRSETQMRSSIDRVNRVLAGHPCVLWTTVKVDGIGFYGGGHWVRSAQRWNRLIADHARGTVLDWNAIAATHPRYFVEDGLHMTLAGRQAYAAFLRTGVLANS